MSTWSKTKYEGDLKNEWFEGEGKFHYPNGVVYEGQFRKGEFHGEGALVYPNGGAYKAKWDRGFAIDGMYVFNDGLPYEDRDWQYVSQGDRRFHTEELQGLQPAGKTLLTNEPTPPIPKGTYDYGSGYYDPATEQIMSYDGNLMVHEWSSEDDRKREEQWILDYCRKGFEDNPLAPKEILHIAGLPSKEEGDSTKETGSSSAKVDEVSLSTDDAVGGKPREQGSIDQNTLSTETSSQPAFTILMPRAGWSKARNYLDDLRTLREQPSRNLVKQVGNDFDFTQIDHVTLMQHLLQTKLPQIFAESAVRGDGSDWSLKELTLLGDVSFAVPVRIFDNGAHVNPVVHDVPFQGTLLYTCGALLQPDNRSADWEELVTKDLTLNDQAYFELYERRLLPCFQYANDCAGRIGRRAFITIPGLGCGQFAGRFQGTLGEKLSTVIQQILQKHGASWLNIHVVYYDAFKEGEAKREAIEGTTITYIVQPLGKSGPNGRCQLCPPKEYEGALGGEGDDFSMCDLFSFVAWDHVSWPGNDYWGGSRATDDGVKAAATDSMYKLSGVEGSYNAKKTQYMPPDTYRSWQAVLKKNHIKLDLSSLKDEN